MADSRYILTLYPLNNKVNRNLPGMTCTKNGTCGQFFHENKKRFV